MGKRKPLPFVVGAFRVGHVCYLGGAEMKEALRRARVRWRFRNVVTSATLADGSRVKSIEGFSEGSHEEIGQVAEVCAAAGVGYPSSWADVYHRLNPNRSRIPWSFNAGIARYVAGGWQEVFAAGKVGGPVNVFDLNSAYAWAATAKPLPRIETFRLGTPCAGAIPDRGFGVADFTLPPGDYPYPLRAGRQRALLDGASIERFRPVIHRWHRWIEFDDGESLEGPVGRILERFDKRTAKKILRTFWGRWIASGTLWTEMLDGGGLVTKHWKVPNVGRNFLWGHIITERVRRRLFEEVQRGALAVYVDAILTRRTLPVGERLGDWRLSKVFPQVYLRGARGFTEAGIQDTLAAGDCGL